MAGIETRVVTNYQTADMSAAVTIVAAASLYSSIDMVLRA